VQINQVYLLLEYITIIKKRRVKLLDYLEVALDMAYAEAFNVHQLKNELGSCTYDQIIHKHA
jgi:hypothetical protein